MYDKLIKFIGYIWQNLKKRDYEVYHCEDTKLPNCLMVARNGKKCRLMAVHSLVSKSTINDDRIVYDIIMQCSKAFRGSAVA